MPRPRCNLMHRESLNLPAEYASRHAQLFVPRSLRTPHHMPTVFARFARTGLRREEEENNDRLLVCDTRETTKETESTHRVDGDAAVRELL